MSGENWLKRDLSQSPGLQRVEEARRAAALAKTQREQWAREAEVAAREAEQRRAEMLARIEQKTAQVLPLLEEIRDFANRTRTYPYGAKGGFCDGYELDLSKMEVVRRAKVVENSFPLDINDPEKPAKSIELRYGYRGSVPKYRYEEGSGLDSTGHRVSDGYAEAVVYFGIRLEVHNNGIITTFKRETVHVPYHEGKSCAWTGYPPIPAHDEARDVEMLLPEDPRLQKDMLSAIFHDPIHLGTE